MPEAMTRPEGVLIALLVALAATRGGFEVQHRHHWTDLTAAERGSMVAPFLVGAAWLGAVAVWMAGLGPLPRMIAPTAVVAAGAALALGGVALLARSHHALGDRFALAITVPARAPVHRGPYARIRHPMYAAGMLFLGGCALVTLDALVAMLGVAYVGILVRRIPEEDALLTEAFGEEHARYVATTPALLPRIRGG